MIVFSVNIVNKQGVLRKNMIKYWFGFVLVLSIVAASITSEENCDELGVLIYENFGCKPHYKHAKKCPFKYSCKVLKNLENGCFHNGKVYAIGELLEEGSGGPCDLGCNCSKAYDGGNRFNCAVVNCFFGPVKPGCYRKSSPFQCCPGEEICIDDIDRPHCEVEGRTYSDGQSFSLESTCMNCTCEEGFTGKLEPPFCERNGCGKSLGYNNFVYFEARCAPLYSSDKILCCPLLFVCPKGNEIIEGKATSDEVCQFGESKLKVGQFVQQDNIKSADGKVVAAKAKCECILPPLLTCQDLK